MSDWKDVNDCKVNQQHIKCELTAVIEPSTPARWGAFIQLHDPSAGSTTKLHSETIPPR